MISTKARISRAANEREQRIVLNLARIKCVERRRSMVGITQKKGIGDLADPSIPRDRRQEGRARHACLQTKKPRRDRPGLSF